MVFISGSKQKGSAQYLEEFEVIEGEVEEEKIKETWNGFLKKTYYKLRAKTPARIKKTLYTERGLNVEYVKLLPEENNEL